ncbi:MAG: AtpZ/AtpI family protein [Candidatus Margulisbacteria bacterium]|nr:AtpZ/AtpI family protein [Candidatus Margulisiibacteriota bacterium]
MAVKPHIFRAAALGFELAISVVLGAVVGRFLDVRLGSEPWGMVVGLVVGALAGFFNIYCFSVKQD